MLVFKIWRRVCDWEIFHSLNFGVWMVESHWKLSMFPEDSIRWPRVSVSQQKNMPVSGMFIFLFIYIFKMYLYFYMFIFFKCTKSCVFHFISQIRFLRWRVFTFRMFTPFKITYTLVLLPCILIPQLIQLSIICRQLKDQKSCNKVSDLENLSFNHSTKYKATLLLFCETFILFCCWRYRVY